MTDKKKPLPRPAKKPFGPSGTRSRPDAGSRTTEEEIAAAAARGDLENYMARRFDNNPAAARLAEMMMGLTGMPVSPPASRPSKGSDPGTAEAKPPGEDPPPAGSGKARVPEDIVGATAAGDVATLMELLKREHRRRRGEAADAPDAPDASVAADDAPSDASEAETPAAGFIEKDVLDGLLRMARENDVTIDWLVARALRLFVRDYRTTGRM